MTILLVCVSANLAGGLAKLKFAVAQAVALKENDVMPALATLTRSLERAEALG